MATGRTSRAGRWSRVALGLAVSALFVWLLLRRADLGRMVAEIRDVTAGDLAAIAALLVGGHAARIVRWSRLLQWTGTDVPVRHCVAPYLIGVSLNNLLPLRAGDVYRIVAFGERAQIARTRLLGSIIVERLLDFTVLFVFLAGGLMSLQDASIREGFMPWITAVVLTVGACATGFVVLRVVLARSLQGGETSTPRHGVRGHLWSLVGLLAQSLNVFATPLRIVSLLALSAIAWTISVVIFGIVAAACGVSDYVASSILAAGAANLAGLLPSSPGSIGTFHYFAAWAYAAHDVPWHTGAAVAVVVHAMLWLPLTLIGLGAVAWRHLR